VCEILNCVSNSVLTYLTL